MSHTPAPSSALGKPSAAPTPRRRSWLKGAIILAVVLPLTYLIYQRATNRVVASTRGGNLTVPVGAEPARKASLNIRHLALGTVTPLATVTVRSRVDGQLQKVFFEEGHAIQAGAPLADIDPRPYEVQKQVAEAQAGRDRALLDNARIDLERFRTLLAQDSISKQQVDTQEALVRQYEATLKLDQAQIETAALNLSYAHVTAPISGRVGLRLIDTGNMVRASDSTGLTVITQLSPISVLFSLPQDALPRILRRFQADEQMVVEIYDRDGRNLLASGQLTTIDNQVDLNTGTVKMRASFANADLSLFPNQFVNVQLIADQLVDSTVVPVAAVQKGSVGSYVYIVSDQKTASVRVVETGASDRGQIAITKGLAVGETVVVDGVDKLREGSTVELIARGNSSNAAPASPDAARPKRQREGGHTQGKPSATPTP